MDQARDGPGETVRKDEGEPDRGHQQKQRDDHEDCREFDLEFREFRFHECIVARRAPRGLPQLKNIRVDEPADIEKHLGLHVESHERAHPVPVLRHQHDRLAVVRVRERPGRRQVEAKRRCEPGLGYGALERIEKQRAMHGMTFRENLEAALGTPAVRCDLRPDTDELLGHRDGVGPEDLLVLAQVGVRHPNRALDRLADPVAEPVLDGDIEKQRREHDRQNGRNDRDDGEQADQPDMQARGGEARPALAPHANQSLNDDRAERQDEDEVDRDQHVECGLAHAEIALAGEREERCDGGRDTHGHQDIGETTRDIRPPGPHGHATHRGGIAALHIAGIVPASVGRHRQRLPGHVSSAYIIRHSMLDSSRASLVPSRIYPSIWWQHGRIARCTILCPGQHQCLTHGFSYVMYSG